EGFWENYPPFKERGLDFYDLANPRWFQQDPELAWGFYGHRLHLYRETTPHAGHEMLARWGAAMPTAPFVFTSNVDGQFQKAGFADDRLLECHGSIHHLQCARPCDTRIWSADATDVEVDEETFRARGQLPSCPSCGEIARPNVLMFGDFRWVGDRTERQKRRFADWRDGLGDATLAVVECGAGTAVPTVRARCEQLARRSEATLIRINPREPEAPDDAISIAGGALEVLSAIDEMI
ncbi:MAG: NAD-dependent deacetylase, partial [Bradymonadaceae bacterium]